MRLKHVLVGLIVGAVVPGVATADNRGATKQNALGEVFFEFDSSRLPEVDAGVMEAVAYAARHPSSRIVLDAHCDPIGTSPYNIGLAIRRAEAVRGRLEAMGVPEEQIVLAIYGKEGEHRARYALDRRVTLWPTHDSVASVIDTTLAKRGTAVKWQRPLTTAEIEAAPLPVAYR